MPEKDKLLLLAKYKDIFIFAVRRSYTKEGLFMGRILLTNSNEWNEKLKKINNDVGFIENASRKDKNAYLTVYNKLNHDTENYYSYNGDYIAINGTLFYRGYFGKEAVSALFEDLKEKTVGEVRKEAYGSYAVIFKRKDTLLVFCDETHTYNLYYYFNGIDYIITNTYSHIEMCVHNKLHEDAFLARNIRGGGVVGRQSPYERVYALSARQSLVIDIVNNSINCGNVYLNDYRCHFNSIDEAVDSIWNATQEIAVIRSKYLKKSIQFVTGGIDSRLELSINSYNKDKTVLGYWMGKDIITNGTKSDWAINKRLSEKTGYKSKCYFVGEKYVNVINALSEYKVKKYGEYASKYAGNERWFAIFEELEEIDYVGFGYFGEILRELADLDYAYKKRFNLRDLTKSVFCRSCVDNIFITDSIYSYIEDELYNYEYVEDTNMLTKQQAFNLFSYTRFSADCTINNLANMFVFSFPIFAQKKVADMIFSIPYEWKKNENISLSLTNKWDSRLLDIPYYSHHHSVLCDKRNMTIKTEWKQQAIMLFRSLLKNTFIYKKLYLEIYERLIRSNTTNNAEIFDKIMEIANDSKIVRNSGLKVRDVKNRNGAELPTLATMGADIRIADIISQIE